jgi:aminopeptidase-like protein
VNSADLELDQCGVGRQMYDWARTLFPICRSITGEGTRRTLRFLAEQIPGLALHEVPSGTQAFDWTVPEEWNIRGAWVADESGRRIIDFRENNLHVLGYSEPVNVYLSLEQLQEHLYSLPDQPDAIPYVTSYYKRRWGFCLRHADRMTLAPGTYHAVVESTLAPGSLSYADLVLKGETEDEVLISTYVCHPSMANNELSGPVVACALVRWLLGRRHRRYTYRVVFAPETIGSIVYLSKHLEEMKRNTIAGFVVTCVGDDRAYSFMPSRIGNTLSDRVARHVMKHSAPEYRGYSFLQRGSDERQYCSPRVDLPVVSVMRSKYGTYPEYHTSKDDLSLISPEGLANSLAVLQKCLTVLENNYVYEALFPGEPQLGKRDMYPTLGTREGAPHSVRDILNFLAYADGHTDLVGIAEIIGVDGLRCAEIAALLKKLDLVKECL